MQQQQHIFEVEMPGGEILEIEAPETTPQEQIRTKANQYQIERRAAAVTPSKGVAEYAKSLIPSRRAALTTAGALGFGLAGGTTGPLGAATMGGLGAATGNAVDQLISRITGVGTPAQTLTEDVNGALGAFIGGALQGGTPSYLTKTAPQQLFKGATKRIGESVEVKSAGPGLKGAVQKVIPNAVHDFPIAASYGRLLNKLDKKAEVTGKAVTDAYNKAAHAGYQFQAKPIIDALNHNKSRSILQGETIVGREARVEAFDKVIEWLDRHPRFDLMEYKQVKGEWDDLLNHARDKMRTVADDAHTEAFESAANTVRDVIHSVFPQLKKADTAFHTTSLLRLALSKGERAAFGREGTYTWLKRESPAALLGAVVGHELGSGYAVGALGGMAIANLPQTAIWNTLSRAERALLIRTLEHPAAAPILKGLSAAVASQNSPEQQSRQLQRLRELRAAQ